MRAVILAFFLSICGPQIAAQGRDIVVVDPSIRVNPGPMASAAGYMTLRNTGDEDDVLTGVSVIGARAMLHRTEERDGIVTMSRVEMVEAPAGEDVRFEPGGLHVMFMGFDVKPEEGEPLVATFTFERAGKVVVSFVVAGEEEAVLRTEEFQRQADRPRHGLQLSPGRSAVAT